MSLTMNDELENLRKAPRPHSLQDLMDLKTQLAAIQDYATHSIRNAILKDYVDRQRQLIQKLERRIFAEESARENAEIAAAELAKANAQAEEDAARKQRAEEDAASKQKEEADQRRKEARGSGILALGVLFGLISLGLIAYEGWYYGSHGLVWVAAFFAVSNALFLSVGVALAARDDENGYIVISAFGLISMVLLLLTLPGFGWLASAGWFCGIQVAQTCALVAIAKGAS